MGVSESHRVLAASSRGGGRKVLVVEDNALYGDLMASCLRSEGFSVDRCLTVEEARTQYNAADFDAAVIDMDLGTGPSGLDLAIMLRAQMPDLPIVFLTDLPDSRHIFGERGMPQRVWYLRKEVVTDVQQLVSVLDMALRGWHSQAVRHDLDQGRPGAGLTQKQVDLLSMVARGMTNEQIAAERGTTTKSVEDSLRRAARRLGIPAGGEVNVRAALTRVFTLMRSGMGLPE